MSTSTTAAIVVLFREASAVGKLRSAFVEGGCVGSWVVTVWRATCWWRWRCKVKRCRTGRLVQSSGFAVRIAGRNLSDGAAMWRA